MAQDTLAVVLGGSPLGELIRLPQGSLRLRYYDAYLDRPAPTPLSVTMPPARSAFSDATVTPWLWGLLPDNADVLGRWGREFGVSLASPFALLGTPVGLDCAGAVQFCPPDQLDETLNRGGSLVPLTEAEVASRLRTLRSDSTSWLGSDSTGQFSLAGAQAKTALHLADGQWGIPTGSLPSTHILKPAVPGFDDQHLNEHICLTAARSLGLDAARTRIETFEDESAIVVTRFDRLRRDETIVRIHQEDLGQALSVPPIRKYQSDGGPTPGRIAELIRATVPAPHTEPDLWRFVDALTFNWLIAGTDAHAKNYGLLLSGNQVRLAPLYDVSSFLPYDDSGGRRLKLAMKLGGDYNLVRTDRPGAWHRLARELKVNPDRLVSRVLDLAARVPTAFAEAASGAQDGPLASNLPDRLTELVDRRAAACRSALS